MKNDPYYLLIRDETQGPFTFYQVRSMWSAGTLTGKTLFSQPGMSEWKPLLDMQEALESADAPKLVPQIHAQSIPASPSQLSVVASSGGNPITNPTTKSNPSVTASGSAPDQPSSQPALTQAAQPNQEKTLLAIALSLLIVLLIGFILSNVQPATDGVASGDKNAYSAACNFIRQRYPGAKEFSSFQDSNVRPTYEAGVFQVEVIVTGVNAFNAPVRNRMIVDVKLQNNKWVYQDHMVKN